MSATVMTAVMTSVEIYCTSAYGRPEMPLTAACDGYIIGAEPLRVQVELFHPSRISRTRALRPKHEIAYNWYEIAHVKIAAFQI